MIQIDNIKKQVGNNLRYIRKIKNLSQEQLAEFVEMDKDSISAIENGRAFVSAESSCKVF